MCLPFHIGGRRGVGCGGIVPLIATEGGGSATAAAELGGAVIGAAPVGWRRRCRGQRARAGNFLSPSATKWTETNINKLKPSKV